MIAHPLSRRFLFTALAGVFFLVAAFARLCGAETVGVLMPGRDIPYYEAVLDAMRNSLDAGDMDVDFIVQRPMPAVMAWNNATRKLVVLDSEILVAFGSGPALAVVSEAPALPLVYSCAYAPSACGIGGNVTGVEAVLDIKGLVAVLGRISHFKNMAVLFSHEEPDSAMQMRIAVKAAEAAGASARGLETHDLEHINLSGYDAVLLTTAANLNSRGSLRMIVAEARRRKAASAALLGMACEEGVLVARYVKPSEMGWQAAKMVAKLLDGKGIGELPAVRRTAGETAINIAEAKRLGLVIPFDLLGTARVVK